MDSQYKKLVPCIYLYRGNAVKDFRDTTVVDTDPVQLAKFYSDNSADELLVFDLSDGDAEHEEALDIIKITCREAEIPVILSTFPNRKILKLHRRFPGNLGRTK